MGNGLLDEVTRVSYIRIFVSSLKYFLFPSIQYSQRQKKKKKLWVNPVQYYKVSRDFSITPAREHIYPAPLLFEQQYSEDKRAITTYNAELQLEWVSLATLARDNSLDIGRCIYFASSSSSVVLYLYIYRPLSMSDARERDADAPSGTRSPSPVYIRRDIVSESNDPFGFSEAIVERDIFVPAGAAEPRPIIGASSLIHVYI